MFRQGRSILFAVFLTLLAALFFFEDRLESALSPLLFKKLASVKALGVTPGFSDFYKSEKIRTESSQGLLEAVVIFRPPSVAYDHLIVSKGSKDGVLSGQIVLAGEDVLIGVIGEVFESSSRVISYSGYGLEQNVFLNDAGISAAAVGRGNGEFEIVLPRDFPAHSGDNVVSLTDPSYLVGFVERIDESVSSPTKKLKIKQPFNIYELFSVQIRL